MHLIMREEVGLEESGRAVDLGLAPADVVVLSFSDSDLATFAKAWRECPRLARPGVTLANLGRLQHPMSVDLFVETTLAGTKAILVRLLGGVSYWRYGVEELERWAQATGGRLAFLAADGRPDPGLNARSTLAPAEVATLQALCDAGGSQNLRTALAVMAGTGGEVAVQQVPEYGIARARTGKGLPATVVFYRSMLEADDWAPISALCDALARRGLDAEALYVTSLKSSAAGAFVAGRLRGNAPRVVLTATAFSARTDGPSPLEAAGRTVLQVALAGASRAAWEANPRGLGASDLAMTVALPEIDGRVFAGAISFKAATGDGAGSPSGAAAGVLRHAADDSLIAAAADLANGWARLGQRPASERRVGLMLSAYPGRSDQMAHAMGLDGPASAAAILAALAGAGYTLPPEVQSPSALMAGLADVKRHVRWPLSQYGPAFARLPAALRGAVAAAWGPPEDDPALAPDGSLRLAAVALGNISLVLQPERGLAADRKAQYHDPAVPPRHGFIATYLWLREVANIEALIHLGAHGSLEWLPGKSVALSPACAPRALLGGLPVLYPFIVNDPGEAACAKRRLGAVTIGHLTPPVATGGLDARYDEIERLVDEFASADGLDPRRRRMLSAAIVAAADASGLTRDLGLTGVTTDAEILRRIDGFLCDVKELSISDGLHVFGQSPAGGTAATAASGPAEMAALLAGLEGRFVEPGPSGAPSRGRADVLPTGRNLYSVDPRSVPTRTAYANGRAAAEALLQRYLEDAGDWPRAILMDLWGSSTLRTGGEEFASALHLMGVRPRWDHASSRVTGFEILTGAEMGRPRVDVTVRISGLFRDVFGAQIGLFNAAVARLAALDEPADVNPLAATVRRAHGGSADRVFGASPGAYGAGVTELIDSGAWSSRADLGRAYLEASRTAYRAEGDAADAPAAFEACLAGADAVLHIHDQAETDILSGGDFAAHQGGVVAAAHALGREVSAFHLDVTDPARPRARTLNEEARRVVLGRAVDARWLSGQMRHGFRGAGEIAGVVDHAFAFAATAGVVTSAHFERLFDATLGEPAVRAFLEAHNPAALAAMVARFREARARGLWLTGRNSTVAALDAGHDGAPEVRP